MPYPFWLKLLETPSEAVDYARVGILENAKYFMLALGIGLGGVFGFWFFIKLSEYLTGDISNKRKRVNSNRETIHHSRKSLIRVIMITLALLSLTAGLWAGAHTAGFNFWTVVLGYGILALIGNNAFGTTLRNAGAFFLIALTDKIEENFVIEVAGITGRIVAIHILWVEILDLGDLENGRMKNEIHVPTYLLLDTIVRRKFYLEAKSR